MRPYLRVTGSSELVGIETGFRCDMPVLNGFGVTGSSELVGIETSNKNLGARFGIKCHRLFGAGGD